MFCKTIFLLPVIDREAAGLLLPELRDALSAEQPVRIDGAAVEQIGQIGLQLLVSAFRTAAAANIDCGIVCPSPALRQAIDYAGLAAMLLDDDRMERNRHVQ